MKNIYLKDKKDRAVLHRHPWIFSGAIQKKDPGIENGEMIAVRGHNGDRLGSGYFNGRTQIAVRLLAFGDREPDDAHLRGLISAAVKRRAGNPLLGGTDSWRLVFSEGDHIPGLIVDAYGPHLVLQSLTLGMDRLKNAVSNILIELIGPESIFERSEHEGRAMEGTPSVRAPIYGTTPAEIMIRENGASYMVNPREGQKTGFYLDQRDNRSMVRALAPGRRVLNLFSYTGGFSVAAARGGAGKIVSVDASGEALDMAKRNMELNGAAASAEYIRADIFQYLRDAEIDSDLIILDPPALAKNRASADNACRGYKELHLQIARKCPPGALLLTCSCSRFIGMDLFQKVVFGAFADAGRTASIIGKYHQPCDHPTSIFCPETEYLKAMLLAVE